MNPIIILWAHHRSMSTAIERIVRERGDFECLHEPFLHYYYIERAKKPLAHFESEQEHPVSYADTRDMLLQKAESGAVFAKDMSYYVIPEILDDTEFCERVTHCFLVRNPLRSIMSYYKLDMNITEEEIGLESQWLLFDGLRQLGIDSPVLEAEAVQQNSAAVMSAFWKALNLADCEAALSWDQNSTPEDWQYVKGWHQSVSDSKGIKADSGNQQKYIDEFEQLCAQAPQLKQFYQHHLPFYQQLIQYGLRPGENATSAD